MKEEKYFVLTFPTTYAAFATETICKQEGLSGRLIPVPRELSAGCGIAWKGLEREASILEDLLKVNEIEWEGIYPFRE